MNQIMQDMSDLRSDPNNPIWKDHISWMVRLSYYSNTRSDKDCKTDPDYRVRAFYYYTNREDDIISAKTDNHSSIRSIYYSMHPGDKSGMDDPSYDIWGNHLQHNPQNVTILKKSLNFMVRVQYYTLYPNDSDWSSDAHPLVVAIIGARQ